MFFMITDPKTIPDGRLARLAYAISVGLLATILIAPQRTEFGAKVALLGALALACAARPLLDWLLPAAGYPTTGSGRGSPALRPSGEEGREARHGGAARLGGVRRPPCPRGAPRASRRGAGARSPASAACPR